MVVFKEIKYEHFLKRMCFHYCQTPRELSRRFLFSEFIDLMRYEASNPMGDRRLTRLVAYQLLSLASINGHKNLQFEDFVLYSDEEPKPVVPPDELDKQVWAKVKTNFQCIKSILDRRKK